MSKKTLFVAKQLVVLMAFLVICSCSSAPMKGYTGADLPANQTALIKAVRATNLETCDGVKLSKNEVIVLPGAHNIEVTWRGGIESYSNEVILVTFKAEAGHTYEISAESVPGARWEYLLQIQQPVNELEIAVQAQKVTKILLHILTGKCGSGPITRHSGTKKELLLPT